MYRGLGDSSTAPSAPPPETAASIALANAQHTSSQIQLLLIVGAGGLAGYLLSDALGTNAFFTTAIGAVAAIAVVAGGSIS